MAYPNCPVRANKTHNGGGSYGADTLFVFDMAGLDPDNPDHAALDRKSVV